LTIPIDKIAGSKDAALILSLTFNLIACAAVWRLWKSREELQAKVTAMLTELLTELVRVTSKLLEERK